MDFALGELGLRPGDFWALTWEEYGHACRHYELREKAREQREIAEWQRTRQLGEWMAAFNGIDLKKELGKVGRKRLLDLPGDDAPAAGQQQETPAQFLARMEQHNFYRKPAEA